MLRLAAKADGVHVGWDDMEAGEARLLLGKHAIIGLSLKTIAQATAAPLEHLDYVAIGGMFATRSKDNPDAPVGLAGLREIAAVVRKRAPRNPDRGDCRNRCLQCRRRHRSRGRRRRGDFGPVARTRPKGSGSGAARYCRSRARPARRGMTAIALTIAGSDSSGGAGIQADLKTFAALGVYGASAITALTAQNTRGVTGIHDVPPDFIAAQIDAVFDDLDVGAVKIGMLSQPATIAAVADSLRRHKAKNIVLDPVMVATSGAKLISDHAIDALRRELIPMALVVTPNLPEAAVLSGASIARNEDEMIIQARALLRHGANNVLIKGGHGAGAESVDLLVGTNLELRRAAGRAARRHTIDPWQRLHAVVGNRCGARERARSR